MHHAILKTEDLQQATGYKQIADVEKCLTKQGIRFFNGKEGPWTTLGLVEAAGGLKPAQEHDSSSIL